MATITGVGSGGRGASRPPFQNGGAAPSPFSRKKKRKKGGKIKREKGKMRKNDQKFTSKFYKLSANCNFRTIAKCFNSECSKLSQI
jgi:hypothetical protein